ncbi:M48 family metallopeptidase [Legionella pneumophila]|uniref:M48 family metallopeptidase n=1 Tax=Legionella pneumophila TaxID=446 RepID=UPI0036F4A9F5
MTDLIINEMDVEVVQKNIKNLHLSVNPPIGQVRVSAPEQMPLEAIKAYVISKLNWIRKQQNKYQTQKREAKREYIEKETHYYNGKSYLLKVTELDSPPRVKLHHSQIELQVRPGFSRKMRQETLERWYRQQLKLKLFELIPLWEKKLNVSVSSCTVRKMKTKWGSCSPQKGTIRINLELAKKPVECLEYIVVHEMVHLIEPSHNNHFINLMDNYLPKWRFYRDELNQLPTCY